MGKYVILIAEFHKLHNDPCWCLLVNVLYFNGFILFVLYG